MKLAGKNSSNLVTHLRRVHADAYTAYSEKQQRRKDEKCGMGVKRHRTDGNQKVQTIADNAECYNRHILKWRIGDGQPQIRACERHCASYE